jgi:MFS transporter, DHA1 family, tetracycline resistance protein
MAAIVQGGLIRRLAPRYGEARLLTAGTAAIVLGLLAIPLSTTLPVLLIVTGILGLGLGLTQPSIASLISREASADEQGEIQGVSQSVGSFARIVGPVLAAALFADAGRNAPYLAGAALMTVVVWFARGLARPAPVALEAQTEQVR